MDLLKKIDNAITKLFFSKNWFIVDLLVIMNIALYCDTYNISFVGSYGLGSAIMLICIVYYLMCDIIRLSFRVRRLENKKGGENNG